MGEKTGGHEPVLLTEVVEGLNLELGDKVMDCTLGLGGHAEKILEKIGETGLLIGIDADESNLESAKKRLEKYKKFLGVRDNFENLDEVWKKAGISKAQAIYFDLGLSSPHVDAGSRGFSFLEDGPLDMRFDQRKKITAEILINESAEEELEKKFRNYGEIWKTRRLIAEIVREREKRRIDSTFKLASIIERLFYGMERKKMMMKVFMALRIAVNDELNVLKTALKKAINILDKNGRIAVISYHSLEDRIVKNFFREAEKECVCPKEVLICNCSKKKELKIITRKPIAPSEEEIERNRRSRSGKLRIAERM